MYKVQYKPDGIFPAHIGISFCELGFQKEMKRMGIKNHQFTSDGATATANMFTDENGDSCYIICFDADKHKKMPLVRVYSTLIHECIHVWQFLKEHIGEKNPGIETEAYFIEDLWIFCTKEYDKFRRRKK